MMARTILIIDENEVSRRALAQFLKQTGYSVYEAEEGEAGLDMMEATRFDVLIAKYHIHGAFDGIDILTYQERLYPGSCKILLTPSASEQIRRLTQLIGFVYLENPISMSELIFNIERGRPEEISAAAAGKLAPTRSPNTSQRVSDR
jgi:DNA-binding NtrC family response regulator